MRSSGRSRGAERQLVVVAGEERVRDGRLVDPPTSSFAAIEGARLALHQWQLADGG